MKNVFTLMLLICPLLFCGQNLVNISGIVREKSTNNPIMGADVVLLDLIKMESTGASGLFNYNVKGLNITSNQKVEIAVYKNNFKPFKSNIQPNGNGSLGEILLEKQKGIYVIVKDSLNDKLICNAIITTNLNANSSYMMINNGIYFIENAEGKEEFFLFVSTSDNLYLSVNKHSLDSYCEYPVVINLVPRSPDSQYEILIMGFNKTIDELNEDIAKNDTLSIIKDIDFMIDSYNRIAELKNLQNDDDEKRVDFVNTNKIRINNFYSLLLNYKFPEEKNKLLQKEKKYSNDINELVCKILSSNNIEYIAECYDSIFDIGVEYFDLLNKINEYHNTRDAKIDLVKKLNSIFLAEKKLLIEYSQINPDGKFVKKLMISTDRNEEKLNNINRK